MSYELLCSKAHTVFGNSKTFKNSTTNSIIIDLPYANVADHSYIYECEKAYETVEHVDPIVTIEPVEPLEPAEDIGRDETDDNGNNSSTCILM